ncbi:hypothetical protein P2T68_16820 [Pseudomonas sp. G11]|uniref:hypothetical protein n=1 Tax=Pseudomonas sp. G11 TaxID=528343 RepID=UPI00240296A3|nr:hypothetical protein [Pseudomonas sp. G11]WEX18907.1 hypothetical protein P2T68_16820 [Pseudomonas sp. G11]
MSTEKLRGEFIVAFVKQFGFGRMAAHSNPDAAAMLVCAEWAWFASRESIEVELPNPAVQGGNCIRNHAIRDTLESLGLKVKP